MQYFCYPYDLKKRKYIQFIFCNNMKHYKIIERNRNMVAQSINKNNFNKNNENNCLAQLMEEDNVNDNNFILK